MNFESMFYFLFSMSIVLWIGRIVHQSNPIWDIERLIPFGLVIANLTLSLFTDSILVTMTILLMGISPIYYFLDNFYLHEVCILPKGRLTENKKDIDSKFRQEILVRLTGAGISILAGTFLLIRFMTLQGWFGVLNN